MRLYSDIQQFSIEYNAQQYADRIELYYFPIYCYGSYFRGNADRVGVELTTIVPAAGQLFSMEFFIKDNPK